MGIDYLLSRASTSNDSLGDEISSIQDKMFSARVFDICLDDKSPMFDEVGEWNGIGAVKFSLLDSPINENQIEQNANNIAYPLFPQIKRYPLKNEIVFLLKLPTPESINELDQNDQFYYINVGIWNHPHVNPMPNPITYSTIAPAQNKSLAQIEIGDVSRVTDEETSLDLNGFSGGEFVERSNIQPLISFAGDNIYEGRFGNSIRLGSTSRTSGSIQNNWSSNGELGDPITILKNGQPSGSNNVGYIPTVENINEDLSSIYLTSYQEIPIEVATSTPNQNEGDTVPFSGVIDNTPISPKSYDSQQIVLNSGRILFNATQDDILLSSNKSTVIESTDNIGIHSKDKNITLKSKMVKLGDNSASQSVILGDSFLQDFNKLLNNLELLMASLEGEPQLLVSKTTAGITKEAIIGIKNNLTNLKSKVVKTI